MSEASGAPAGQPPTISSWPLPPMQYVNLYTDENVKRGKAPRPPPPMQDSYSMFGAIFHVDETIIRPLEDQRIKRVYPQNYDHKRELKKLNHSLIANFLDLLDILVRAPDSTERQEKIEDLRTLFINIHHLVNEFRPHQARETLRVTLDFQKKQRVELADRFHRHLDKVVETLQSQLTTIFASAEEEVPFPSVECEVDFSCGDLGDAVDAERQPSMVSQLDQIMCDLVDQEPQHRK